MIKVPYVNLGLQAKPLMPELLAKVEAVMNSGWYILGPEVAEFEKNFAKYCGTKYAVGVSNGTTALSLVLGAYGIGPGDEVITVPNSFIATASVIALAGAKPVFVDVGPDFNIDPQLIEKAITPKTKMIIPVHLTGRICKMPEIMAIAKKHNLIVLEDSAQAVGAKLNGKMVGSWGHASGFSLHPLKNLRAFGDAGIITTDDDKLYERLKKARNLGFKNRDECEFWSGNERLDEMQAALLNIQLPHLDAWTEDRRAKARKYNDELRGIVKVPDELDDRATEENTVYQTYVVLADKRDQLQEYLVSRGVEAKVHYPIPIHMQEAARALNHKPDDFPNVYSFSKRILSLPLFYGMTNEQQSYVIQLIKEFYAR
jgi:dTDP-4-amino-4,6-dideoxygalactose transaminase